MMEVIGELLMNGGDITFGILFVGLFIYVIKENNAREVDYRAILKENQQIVVDSIKALNGYEEVKEEIKKIIEKLED